MLVEFDMLFAVFALMLVLPVTIFQMISNQNAFLAASKLFSDRLVSNLNAQMVIVQLGGMDFQSYDFAYVANNRSNYSLTSYNQASAADAHDGVYRLAVLGGKMYYLSARK